MEEKILTKQCPKCNKEQVFKNEYSLKTAIKNNTFCKSCRNKINSTGRIVIVNADTKNKISLSLKRYFLIHPISEVTRKKISERVSGEKNGFYGKKHSLETKKHWSEIRKGRYVGADHPFFGKHHSEETIEKIKASLSKAKWNYTEERKQTLSERMKGDLNPSRRQEVKMKLRLAANNRLKKQHCFASYNPKACKIIEDYGKQNGYNFRHALNGGEVDIIGYFVDGYDKKRNTVIEYDEKGHFTKNKLREKDIIRQKNIIKEINCKFIRIKYDGKIEIVE
jgi:hypothetical protein